MEKTLKVRLDVIPNKKIPADKVMIVARVISLFNNIFFDASFINILKECNFMI